MSILIASDIHQYFDLFVRFLENDDIIACICCGDLTIEMPKNPKIPKPIYAVYGNNEKFSLLDADIPNLIWMDAGKVYTIGDLRIAGMGGVMSKTPHNPAHYSEGEVNASLNLKSGDIDIFVVHHPPKFYADLCVARYRHHCGSPDTLKIMNALKPKLFFSGHLHWQQMDIFGDNGKIETYVITMGQFGYGDYGILTPELLNLYKSNIHCFDVYWQHLST